MNVPEHAHCEICQGTVEKGTRFCSEECVAKNDLRVKELKKQRWVFIGIIVALLLLFQLIRTGSI